MGTYTNSKLYNIISIIVIVAMITLSMILLFSTFVH